MATEPAARPSRRINLTWVLGLAAAGLLTSACGAGSAPPARAADPHQTPARHQTSVAARPATPASTAPSAPARPPLAGIVVGIDPGHNGGNFTDPSFLGQQIWNGREEEDCDTTGTETDGGYTEAQYNFNVAGYLRADLLRDGARVVLTRTSNHGVGPCVNRRAQIIDDAHASVAIDIHADGAPVSGRGFAVLEPIADGPNDRVITSSGRLGSDVRAAMLAGTPMPVSNYDGVDGITHRDDLAGLNLSTVPKVLIECGNMRNPTDARLLTSAGFQQQVARALAAAMIRFLGR
ncbi:MAG TPA: N-acetylmuramoyl-L-alanine amidase [Streptosporangiaceae bacterium]